jgi:sporulation protein YlmC with PRC-barrel domain
MKSQRIPIAALASSGAFFALTLTTNAVDITAPARRHGDPASGEAVRFVTDTPAGQSMNMFAEHRLRSARGEELGVIKDLVADAHVGTIAYATVADRTGELRLVPFAALKHDGGDTFTVEIAEQQWRQIAPLSQREFEAGRLTVSEAQRRELAAPFTLANGNRGNVKTAPSAEEKLPESGAQLIRLGDLRGKRVSTGSEDVGTISEIVIDAQKGTASAVLTPERNFASATQKLVVPLRVLNLASRDQNPITTALTRADFEQARQRR